MVGIRDIGCKRCVNSQYCVMDKVCTVSDQEGHYDIMFVGDSVTAEDEKLGVMNGRKYELPLKILTDVISYKSEVYKSYLLKCNTNGNVPSEQDYEKCYYYLKKEIVRVKPKVIVAFGENALNVLCRDTQIMDKRGHVYEKTITDGDESVKTIVIPTYSLGYVSKVKAAIETIAKDLHKATLMCAGVMPKGMNTQVITIENFDMLERIVEDIKKVGTICFDFETTDADGLFIDENFKATCLAMSYQHGCSFVLPLYHDDSPFSDEEIDDMLDLLRIEVFESDSVRKINQNIKYERHILRHLGIELKGRIDDTMLMHHILDNTEPHGLKEFAIGLYPDYDGYDNEVHKYKWADVPLDKLITYAGIDTDLTLRSGTQFLTKIMEDPRLYILYRNLVLSVFSSLADAEYTGMPVDRKFLLESITETEGMLKRREGDMLQHPVVKRFIVAKEKSEVLIHISNLQDELAEYDRRYEADGKKIWLTNKLKKEEEIKQAKFGNIRKTKQYKGFNMNSPDQLAELFYDSKGFGFKAPYVKAKKAVAETTAKDYIKGFGDKSGFVDSLLIYRSLETMRNRYMVGVYNKLSPNNRIHTSFLQHGTETGRLSSAKPNMQNVPTQAKIDDSDVIETVAKIKTMFLCPVGYTIMQIDYSQAELRLMAEYAEETTMIKAYLDGLDLHALTAANMINVAIEAFYKLDPKEQKKFRTRAKAGNFGLIYGMSAEGFMDYAKSNYGVVLSKEEAEEIRVGFFKLYPKILDYHAKYIAICRKFGYVRTFMGRKRSIPDIYSPVPRKRAEGERAAINTPIQGTAGEFTLFAIALLSHRLNKRVLLANTVHDSIIYYVPNDLLEETAAIARNTCENLPLLEYFGKELKHVKMGVDLEVSTKNWKELQPYE